MIGHLALVMAPSDVAQSAGQFCPHQPQCAGEALAEPNEHMENPELEESEMGPKHLTDSRSSSFSRRRSSDITICGDSNGAAPFWIDSPRSAGRAHFPDCFAMRCAEGEATRSASP